MKVLTNVQGRGWFKKINHSPQESEDSVSIDEAGLFFTHARSEMYSPRLSTGLGTTSVLCSLYSYIRR